MSSNNIRMNVFNRDVTYTSMNLNSRSISTNCKISINVFTYSIKYYQTYLDLARVKEINFKKDAIERNL